MTLSVCEVYQLGLVDYQQAWDLQESLAVEIAQEKRPATLLLLEHPPTYTFGRRGHAENLLWDKAELSRRGIRIYWVDRGGDVTYHGPGQLVGYPLLPLGLQEAKQGKPEVESGGLRLPQADYIGYLRKLEQVIIHALDRLGVHGQRLEGMTGVWVQPPSGAESRPLEKVAAIGVKVDARGVSRHGFALNVEPRMENWQGIVACGLDGYTVTSLAEFLSPVPPMEQVSACIVEAFGEIFGYEIISKASPWSLSS